MLALGTYLFGSFCGKELCYIVQARAIVLLSLCWVFPTYLKRDNRQ